jgi:hypothetical protein
VVVVGLAGPATAAEALKLASTYDEVGTKPRWLEIHRHRTTFSIQWKIGSIVYSGFGMRTATAPTG